jgi:hypothetical protein
MPRPKLNPNEEQRRLVKSMAAVGIPHEHIARKIGIRSPKTLREHFREELDMGMIDANYNVASTLYQMATSGKHPAATIFYLKTRLCLQERPADDVRQAKLPDLIVTCEQGGQPHGHA